MSDSFFEKPILNSPYAYPGRHWELDADGQPTDRIIGMRRRSDLVTPVPKSKKQGANQKQRAFVLGGEDAMSSETQEYNPKPIINEVGGYLDTFLRLLNLVKSSILEGDLKAKIDFLREALYYVLRRLRLDTAPSIRSPQDQQFVLPNHDAIFDGGTVSATDSPRPCGRIGPR